MPKVLIVGAGQSGLQLALSLREHDHDVTVMSARTPTDIRGGRVTSTQCMFADALAIEQRHGLDLWAEDAVRIPLTDIAVAGPGTTPALSFTAPFGGDAQSVDQRVKMAGWLELLEERGGKVVIHGATTADLDRLTDLYDLVVVAAGKGELVQLFDRDPARSPYTVPQRSLSLAYVHGLRPHPRHPEQAGVQFTLLPGVGELIIIPGYTLSGNCDILLLEGIPGGPLDAFADKPGPQEQLDRILDLVRRHAPWEYERAAGVELTDSRATLFGGYTPMVRFPVGELPSGGAVLGMADVVVANDPITGQGSNNAARCAEFYLEAILEHGDGPFDRAWMNATFQRYWDYAEVVTTWTNAMLSPPPEHVLAILGASQTNPAVASRFARGFSNPTDLQHWFLDPAKAAAYLAEVS